MIQMGKSMTIDTCLDCIVCVSQDKIPGFGEDSFCYRVTEEGVLLGVFDGCGGSGAKKYPAYQNRSGAYMSARAIAGAVYQWMEDAHSSELSRNCQTMKAHILQGLSICKENCGGQGSKLKGSISKEFPTTAAVACCAVEGDDLLAECYWAGDSRVYLLDENGLAQLTADDLDDPDAFENISGDGVLTNVISASMPFTLHSRRIALQKPSLVFAVSDGCYGYIPSPMEFEGVLLEQLQRSQNMAEFEENLRAAFAKTAGDDFTLTGAFFGFGTFPIVKKVFWKRYQALIQGYLSHISRESESRKEVWNRYRRGYYRYYKG